MDINDVRIGTTVISLVMFVGIMVWTWSRRNKDAFDEASRLPFRDE